MADEPRQIMTLELDARGVPQELKLNGESLSISAEQKQRGEELLDVLAKTAASVLALQNQPATRGRG